MDYHSSISLRTLGREQSSLLDLLEGRAAELLARRLRIPKAKNLEVSAAATRPVLILITGRLTVYASTQKGVDVFMTDLEPGEIVGESAAFGNDEFPLLVRASEESQAWAIDQRRFLSALTTRTDFSMAVMHAMCRRLCRIHQRLVDQVSLPMRDRLKTELLRMAVTEPDGALVITWMPTHEELALRIATQREAVTKELAKLARTGVLVRNGRSIRIPSLLRFVAQMVD
ncbi:Crp/Fnr family transcriptional regulator [Xanthobacter autotrophicus]|uniref:Crp/Fnr family transcriptional regulator n=1 Tax=Xanthobacter autotrophicus TaxID=280 RepID=UPI001E39EA8B|nr:Crp/Fnr family transcriptional regulator [Xanthobacter autotrophicus]UDQ92001.1 Crp/Fnr family transcriptional regulator [Xanthobacter autotrophicus]